MWITIRRMIRFNPRARVGRDRNDLFGKCSRPSFNPRARVGRDPRQKLPVAFIRGFNPRARVGRDIRNLILPIPCAKFQSTRPRGARHSFHARTTKLIYVSIHAPAWGATLLIRM